MFHLDYISCLLTVVSTVLVGRRMWQGWIFAGANSLIICWIGLRTAQLGFIPANLFCLAIYVYNISRWRSPLPSSTPACIDPPERDVHSVVRLSHVLSTAEEPSELLHQC